jgi:hypothetical protein
MILKKGILKIDMRLSSDKDIAEVLSLLGQLESGLLPHGYKLSTRLRKAEEEKEAVEEKEPLLLNQFSQFACPSI